MLKVQLVKYHLCRFTPLNSASEIEVIQDLDRQLLVKQNKNEYCKVNIYNLKSPTPLFSYMKNNMLVG